ncbi:tyrosine-type recombinase/integrase [Paenibacillus polymyxa]|uniref:tyrosine-type recombinase/integrase n=1 Tax=Paenibacillus polymyxa TaxID=1406 RepID=UPI0032AF82FA
MPPGPKTSKKLPYAPTEEELKRYDAVWQAKNFQDLKITKTLLYTGGRVSELINIKLTDVDFHYYQIRINKGEGSKNRIVPFLQSFKGMLAMHANSMKKKQEVYLFQSSGVSFTGTNP